MFESFYGSALQHPILLWVAAGLGLVAALARRGVHGSVRRVAIGMALLAALDAWLTSSVVPGLGALSGSTAKYVGLTFVILGDLRYLALREAMRDGQLQLTRRGAMRALAWAFVVPVLVQLVTFVYEYDGVTQMEGRLLFLLYEVCFLALLFRRRRYVRRGLAGDDLRWHGRVTRLVAAWYGLWVLADLVIHFAGLDVGYAIRVVPNLLYYGALPAAVVWSKPAD